MVGKTSKNGDLQTDFVTLATEAAQAASQLERGQAETPITEAIQQLLEMRRDLPLVISLLCLTDAARRAMLNWLIDAPAVEAFAARATKGLTRICLNSPVTEREEMTSASLLPNPSPSSAGLAKGRQRSIPTVRSSTDVIVHGRAEGPWRSVEVLVPATMAALWKDARAYQQFCTSGHLLMVCGEPNAEVAEGDLAMMANVSSAFQSLWPVLIGSAPQGIEHASWQSVAVRSHAGRLSELFLPPHAMDGGGAVLANPADPLRRALLFERRARALKAAIDNLAQRHGRESVRLAERRVQLGDAPKHNQRLAVSSDKDLVASRELFTEGLALLEKQICVNSDRATQPLGKFSNLMREMISQLNVAALDQEISADSLKLMVNARHLATVNRRVEHALRQELTDNATLIDRQLKQLASNASEELGEILEAAPLAFPRLNENQLWTSVENLMAIGKETQIELARKGFFDVLTAGRQKVFIIIMFVSLLGRMGMPKLFESGLAQTGFQVFMAAIMIGSMVNALLAWRREKRSQSEKEMSKIRDTLFGDGCKVIDQVEKSKLLFFREYFREVGKVFDQQTKRAAEEYAIQQRSQLEAESHRREVNRQSLDGQLRIVTEMGKQVTRLRDDAHRLLVAAVEAIYVAASCHQTVSASAATPATAAETIATAMDLMPAESQCTGEDSPDPLVAGTAVAESPKMDAPVSDHDQPPTPAMKRERTPRPVSRAKSKLAERRAARAAAEPTTR